MKEDEMVGWHHRLNGLEFEQPLGVGDDIQPSHPQSSLFLPSFNLSQRQGLQMSQLFASGDQSIGVSASASVLPMNIRTDFL